MQNNSLTVSEKISYNPMGKKHNRFWDELNIRDFGEIVLLIYMVAFFIFSFIINIFMLPYFS